MSDLAAFADQYHLVADWVVLSLVLAACFDNGFWRGAVIFVCYHVQANFLAPLVNVYLLYAVIVGVIFVPTIKHTPFFRKRQPSGNAAVFITGCDSGMGEATAVMLATKGWHVFAGCYLKDSGKKLCSTAGGKNITPISLDVTSEDSVSAAASAVQEHAKYKELGLISIINCAGLGFNGPVEYFPIEMYKKQMDVNFFGYVRVTQALLPLLRKSLGVDGIEEGGKHSENSNAPLDGRRGRVVFIGTGGGHLSPTPPLLSAYMASKFGIEAFCGSLRNEMSLRRLPIDCCMVNPGFVKPTMLMTEGLKLTESMWAQCEKKIGSSKARDEYGKLLETFIEYSAKQPGTHVSEVAKVMQIALTDHRPYESYRVGPDSQAAPIVGSLPRDISEWIVKLSMYGTTGSS
jgi:NAD(P)-dependent dehydrogenase (short-subunit alcohol dehydrogenase family)